MHGAIKTKIMSYQKLFDYMSNEHGLTLLQTDMQDICSIINEMENESAKNTIKTKVLIIVDGGIVQEVISNNLNIEIKILDFDDQSEEECCETEWSEPDTVINDFDLKIEEVKKEYSID
jgi:hypothetical protein